MTKFLVICLGLFINFSVFAQQNQHKELKDLEQQRINALRDIANTDKQLQDTKKTTLNLMNRIQLIADQIISRKKVLDLMNRQIESINAEQIYIEKDITKLELELKEKQKSYAKAIESMLANRQNSDKIVYILSGKSLTENYRRFLYLKDYSEWRSRQADDIRGKSTELNLKKKQLADSKLAKVLLIGQRTGEQANLEKEENNFKSEMGEAQKKQKELQKILAEKKRQAEDLNKQITKLIAEDIVKVERAAKLRAVSEKIVAKDPEKIITNASTSTIKADESTRMEDALASSFASNKGRLPYPISGSTTITGEFGTHQHSQWNITTTSNGIDIKSQTGAHAKAVFNGEVTKVVAFPGYNNCIIIRHGNYYTFYGNIQSVTVKAGDTVSTGQTLGQVFTDPDLGASQMHFQLWEGNHKLNPSPWLSKP